MTEYSNVTDRHAVFEHTSATALAHARLAFVARSQGIRCLSIKGPVANAYRLRPPRTSADADVLVDPAEFDRFCDAMLAFGWHPRVAREVPGFFGSHSVTMIHDEWPCDIDIHFRFPGFFADPAEVFEVLWNDRSSLLIAQTVVIVPSLAGSAVIAALHSERYESSRRGEQEREQLVERVATSFSTTERARVYEIATRGRAVWVLGDIIERLGLGEVKTDATAREQQAWTRGRKNSEHGAVATWADAIRQAPLRQKARLVWSAFWVPRADVPRNHADRLPSLRETWGYRVKRWARGAATLRRRARRARER